MDWQKLSDRVAKSATRTFGETVDYRPQLGGSYEIHAIFSEAFVDVDPETQFVILSRAPNIGVRLNDLPNEPRQDDVVYIRNTRYVVHKAEYDGEAMFNLLLHKAPLDISTSGAFSSAFSTGFDGITA
jgi:hypothetical protein